MIFVIGFQPRKFSSRGQYQYPVIDEYIVQFFPAGIYMMFLIATRGVGHWFISFGIFKTISTVEAITIYD
jgi:hypothetical protein